MQNIQQPSTESPASTVQKRGKASLSFDIQAQVLRQASLSPLRTEKIKIGSLPDWGLMGEIVPSIPKLVGKTGEIKPSPLRRSPPVLQLAVTL